METITLCGNSSLLDEQLVAMRGANEEHTKALSEGKECYACGTIFADQVPFVFDPLGKPDRIRVCEDCFKKHPFLDRVE